MQFRLVLILAVVLGGAIAAQVQLTNERGLDQLSQTDLVRVLDDITGDDAGLREAWLAGVARP